MKSDELHSAVTNRTLPPVLYLFGSETFLRDQSLSRIREQYVDSATADFNYDLVEGGSVTAHQLMDMANAMPTFSDWRLVVIREAHKLAAAELDQLLPYLKDPSPTTLLVFVGEKIDRRKKFFQDFKKHGALIEFKPLYENQIPAFVSDQAKQLEMRMTEAAMAMFCRRVGTSLQEISTEISKLSTYLGGGGLADVADIEAIVSESRSENVFKLTDAIGEHRTRDALQLVRKLLEDGEAPLMIVAMITRYYRQLWSACELLRKNSARGEMTKKIGINPYFLDGLLAQARKSSPRHCRAAFERLLEVDLSLKSSGAHPSALLDRLLLELTGATQQEKGAL